MNRLSAAESAEMRDFVLNLCDKEKPELLTHPMSFIEGSQKRGPRENGRRGAGISGQLGGLALSCLAMGGGVGI